MAVESGAELGCRYGISEGSGERICKYVDIKSLLNCFLTITNFCIAFF
jgi:hypothetical protein